MAEQKTRLTQLAEAMRRERPQDVQTIDRHRAATQRQSEALDLPQYEHPGHRAPEDISAPARRPSTISPEQESVLSQIRGMVAPLAPDVAPPAAPEPTRYEHPGHRPPETPTPEPPAPPRYDRPGMRAMGVPRPPDPAPDIVTGAAPPAAEIPPVVTPGPSIPEGFPGGLIEEGVKDIQSRIAGEPPEMFDYQKLYEESPVARATHHFLAGASASMGLPTVPEHHFEPETFGDEAAQVVGQVAPYLVAAKIAGPLGATAVVGKGGATLLGKMGLSAKAADIIGKGIGLYAGGATIGAPVAATREFMQSLNDPEAADFKNSMVNIARDAHAFGTFRLAMGGIGAPLGEKAVQSLRKITSPIVLKAIDQSAARGAVAANLSNVLDTVTRSITGAAPAGATVGMMDAFFNYLANPEEYTADLAVNDVVTRTIFFTAFNMIFSLYGMGKGMAKGGFVTPGKIRGWKEGAERAKQQGYTRTEPTKTTIEEAYRELGVAPGTPLKDVKHAYRNLSKQYHPDKRPGDTAAEEKFKRIASAYATIVGSQPAGTKATARPDEAATATAQTSAKARPGAAKTPAAEPATADRTATPPATTPAAPTAPPVAPPAAPTPTTPTTAAPAAETPATPTAPIADTPTAPRAPTTPDERVAAFEQYNMTIPQAQEIARLPAEEPYWAARAEGLTHEEGLQRAQEAPVAEPTVTPEPMPQDELMRGVLQRGGIKPPRGYRDAPADREAIPEALQRKEGLPLEQMAGELGMTKEQLVGQLSAAPEQPKGIAEAEETAPEVTPAPAEAAKITPEAKEVSIREIDFQSEDVKKAIVDEQEFAKERGQPSRVDIFKQIIQTGEDYRGFKAEDVLKPIDVVVEGDKYVTKDGNHLLMAYQELGYDTVPIRGYQGASIEKPVTPAPAEVAAEVPAKEPWEMVQSTFVSDKMPGGSEFFKQWTTATGRSGKTQRDKNDMAAARQAQEAKIKEQHEQLVQQALSEGKPVPAEVLADYPDLKPAETPPAPVETVPEAPPVAPTEVPAETPAEVAPAEVPAEGVTEAVAKEPWEMTTKEFEQYSKEPVKAARRDDWFNKSAFISPEGEYVYLERPGEHRAYRGLYEDNYVRKTTVGELGTLDYEVKELTPGIQGIIQEDMATFPQLEDRRVNISVPGEGKAYSFEHNVLQENDFNFRKALRDPRTEVTDVTSSEFEEATISKVRKTQHRNAVQQALAENKPVPQEVLAEYPDLAPEVTPAAAPAAATPAPAETPAEVTPETPELPISVAKDDIPYDLARQAYSGISHTPERRAEQAQQNYIDDITGLYERMRPLATTPEQQELLKTEMERYKENYINKYTAYLNAKSRTMSPMITGPAKFPTARNEKAMRTEAKRREEFLEWNKKAVDAIEKKLKADDPVPADREFKRLKNRVDQTIATLKDIEEGAAYDASTFKSNLAGVLRRSADAGNVTAVRQALDHLKEKQGLLKRPVFTDRHAIWNYPDKAEAKTEAEPVKAGTTDLASYEGAKIVNDHDADRTQILFDEKPSDAIRRDLKSEGWKWAPSAEAWQRKLTSNAENSAKRIIGKHFEKAETPAEVAPEPAKPAPEKPEVAQSHYGTNLPKFKNPDAIKIRQAVLDRLAEHGTSDEYAFFVGEASEKAFTKHGTDTNVAADKIIKTFRENHKLAPGTHKKTIEAGQKRIAQKPEAKPKAPAEKEAKPEAPPKAPEPAKPKPKEVSVVSTGKSVTPKTEKGTPVKSSYAVVEADNIIPSHDTSLKVNPDYPKELQPRDRTRVASEEQVNRMAVKLEPEFLGESPKVSEGAPIIGADGIVESGNARVIALQRVYNKKLPTAKKYRDWLNHNADKFGINRKDLKEANNPVLVRVRAEDLDRAKFVQEANEQAVAAMSASEQATADAGNLTAKHLEIFNPGEAGEILTSGNRSFVNSFMNDIVGEAQRAQYLTRDGSLSQEGAQRIRNAVFARAYGDTGALEKLAEATDVNVKNQVNAMVMAAPRMVRLKDAINKRELHDLDITPEIAAAMNKLSELRESGRTVDYYLRQVSLIEDLSPLAKDVLEVFDGYKRSAKKISSILQAYADGVEMAGNPRQETLFKGENTPTKAEVLERAVRKVEGLDQEQIDIFAGQGMGGTGTGTPGEKAPSATEPDKTLPESLKGTGFLTREHAQLAFDAKDLGFNQWKHTFDEDRAKIFQYTGELGPKAAYSKLIEPLKNLKASEIKERRIDLQIFARKTGKEPDLEFEKARRKMHAISKKLGMDRNQRLDLARFVTGRKDINSTKELTRGEMQFLADFLSKEQHKLSVSDRVKPELTEEERLSPAKKRRTDTAKTAKKELDDARKAVEKEDKEIKRLKSLGFEMEWASDVYKARGKTPPKDFVDHYVGDMWGGETFAPAPRYYDKWSKRDIALMTSEAGFLSQTVRKLFRTLPRSYTDEGMTQRRLERLAANKYARPVREALKGMTKQERYEVGKALEGLIEPEGKIADAAKKIRKEFFDPLFKQGVDAGVLTPEQYVPDYFSRISNKMKKITGESFRTPKRWFTHQRTGHLDDYKTDPLEVCELYAKGMARAIHLDPWLDKWKSEVKKWPKTRQKLAETFTDAVYGRPHAHEIGMNTTATKAMNTLLEPLNLKISEDRRIAHEISTLFIDASVQTFLGLHMGAAWRNTSQKLLSIAEVSTPGDRFRGFRYWGEYRAKKFNKEFRDFIKKYNVLRDDRTFMEGMDSVARYNTWAGKVLDTTRPVTMFAYKAADLDNVDFSWYAGFRAAEDDGMQVVDQLWKGDDVAVRTQFPYDIRKAPWAHTPLGRSLMLFTGWSLDYFELMNDWASNKNWGKLLMAVAAGYGLRHLYRKMGLHFRITALEAATGTIFFSLPGFQDSVVGSQTRTLRYAARDLMEGGEEWQKVVEQMAYDFLPGGGAFNRYNRFMEMANDPAGWVNRDRSGRIRYRYEESGWLYELTGIPREAFFSLFGQTTTAKDYWSDEIPAIEDKIEEKATEYLRKLVGY